MVIALSFSSTAIYWFVIIALGLLLVAIQFKNQFFKKSMENQPVEEKPWPLGINDNFVSNAERSFWGVLKIFADNKYLICPKVCLRDVLFIQKNIDSRQRINIQNRIDRKHLDFLLLDVSTLRPVYAVELDDASHRSSSAQKRDEVKDKALKDAGLAMIRIPAQAAYTIADIENFFSIQSPGVTESIASAETVTLCPRCHVPMILRQATKGAHAGSAFYGCPNYPQCRETKPVT